ncbi:MAG TPA: hypothetical protein VJP40_03870 [bacterium]|nr:hypothetical protein [bacterium]
MKSLLFTFALVLLFSSQAQAQIYAGDDYNSQVPPTVHYRDGKPYVPGYNTNNPNAPRGQTNTVEVGRPYPYYGYPGYGYGYGYGGGAYNDGNTVVVGQPYYGYGVGYGGYGYGYGGGIYTDSNTVYVGY